MSSSIGVKGFYAGKNIFLTGGSGFLGICFLEKLLRTIPEHGHIYLLLRPKKGKNIKERLEEIKANKIFEPLLEQKSLEEAFEKVTPIAGDVSETNLGMSETDRKMLFNKVNVIVHSAATLDFGDTLKTTVDVNLLGTRRVTEFAKECPNLKVFIHVSSAYVNSFQSESEEIIYPLPVDTEELLETVNKLSPEELVEQTPKILGEHPNTYTITKHMAEVEVQKVQELFPCTIVRPSMITGAWKEPIPGWTISKNGPQGFIMGAAKGVIRRLPVGKDLIYDYIPVDIVVNNMLVAGFHAGVTQAKKVEIYHCTSSTRNPFRWADIENKINLYLNEYPLKSAVWYPHLKLVPTILWFKISAFFVHVLPAILLDFVTKIGGGRPILLKLHRNVYLSLDRLEKFIFCQYIFTAVHTKDLHEWLSPQDKDDFTLDISTLSWVDYFLNLVKGVRTYLNKEPMKNLQAARTKNTILWILHLILQGSIFAVVLYSIACLCGITLKQSVLALPLMYFLYNLL